VSTPTSSPEALSRDPELAALEILAAATDIARRALFATYPEIVGGDFFVEQPDVTARQCLTVGLLTSIDVLADAIEHYRAHLDNLASVSLARVHDNDF
jgi:hypothetical protein